jgi:hypothetical protein
MPTDDDVFLKMTLAEGVEYIEAFDMLRKAHELATGYEKAIAIQQAKVRIARVRRLMADAARRPTAGGPRLWRLSS